MAELPRFDFTTQESWHGEVLFLDGDNNGTPLPLTDGDGNPRAFEMLITPAIQGDTAIEPIKTLAMGDGLSFKDSTYTTLVFDVDEDDADSYARGDYTADILEVVDGERRLFMPVRIRYYEPSAFQGYEARSRAVTFSASRQPVVTNAPLIGPRGPRGATILSAQQPPSAGDGTDGDFWMDLSASPVRLYGPKANGAWPGTGIVVQSLTLPELLAARDDAVLARDAAITARDAAQNAAGAAGSGPATTLLYPLLNKALVAATDVVDVFVYDCRLDDDEGAWTRKCEHTSWYQEALSTSIRGAKREFPKVAGLVLRSNASAMSLTIYDLTDLDGTGTPRMWMVLAGGTNFAFRAAGTFGTAVAATSVYALNGRIYIGSGVAGGSGTGGLSVIIFPLDTAEFYWTGYGGRFPASLAQRQTNTASWYTNSGLPNPIPALIDRNVFSIHARVLPGAPLDGAGLPIPTVVVGCSHGISVIHPNGTVASVTGIAAPCTFLQISAQGELLCQRNAQSEFVVLPLPYATTTMNAALTASGNPLFNPANNPAGLWPINLAAAITSVKEAGDTIAKGSTAGLMFRQHSRGNPRDGMISYAAMNYATGWQPGSIMLAALGEGITGTIGTAAPELITNGGFDTDLTNWTVAVTGGATVAQSNGTALITPDANNAAYLRRSFTTVVGQIYSFIFDVISNNVTVSVGTTVAGSDVVPSAGVGVGVGRSITFTAASATTHIQFGRGAAAAAAAVDNVSVRLTNAVLWDDGSNAANWTPFNNGAVASVSGEIQLSGDGVTNYAAMRRTFTTVVGQTYTVAAKARKGASESNGVTLTVRDTSNTQLGPAAFTGATSNAPLSTTFTATTTSTRLELSSSSAPSGNGPVGYLDEVLVTLAVPDRSYKGKGLNVVGNVGRSPVNTGNDLVGLTGFGTGSFLEQPYNADLDFGTGDFMVAQWIKFTATNYVCSLYRRSLTNANGFGFILNNGLPTFVCGTGNYSGTNALNDGNWHLMMGVRRAGFAELWVDGVRITTGGNGQDLTDTSAYFRIGNRWTSDAPFTTGTVALTRISAYAPTPAQIQRVYRDEVQLFDVGAKAFLGGTSNAVSDLDVDTSRNVLQVATGDGVSEFSGLRRTGYFDPTSVAPLTNDNMKACSTQGGYRLLAGGAQVVVHRDAQNGVDEMYRYGSRNRAPPIRGGGVTTDATPTVLGPRITVGERETLSGQMRVVAKQYGNPAGDHGEYLIQFAAKRDAGGNVGIVTSTTTILETTAAMDAVAVADVSAQTIAPQVTGKAATRMIWTYVVEGLVRTSEENSYAA